MLAEEVAVAHAGAGRQEAGAVDVEDALVVAVAGEHGVAKREEGGIGQAVVFQNNPPVNVVKKPCDCGAYRPPATEVSVSFKHNLLFGPIYSIDQGFHGPAKPDVLPVVRPWGIKGDKEPPHPALAKPFQYAPRKVGTVKSNKENRGFNQTHVD